MARLPPPKVIHRQGDYVVTAWLEHKWARDGRLVAYVAVDHDGSRVWFREARLERPPWWAPFLRHLELPAVVADAIEYVYERDHVEQSAEATLNAVWEANQLTGSGGA